MKWYVSCINMNELCICMECNHSFICMRYVNKFPSYILYDANIKGVCSNVVPHHTSYESELPEFVTHVPFSFRLGAYANTTGYGVQFIPFNMFSSIPQVDTKNKIFLRQPCNSLDVFVLVEKSNLGELDWIPHQ